MDFSKDLKINKFGYIEIKSKPDPAELKKYYQDKYYQHDKGAHSHIYSEEEKQFFRNKVEQKHYVLTSLGLNSPIPKLLDIGAGEGWALSYFREQGWDCRGLDFSCYGCETQNPHVLNDLVTGDVFENVANIVKTGECFDVIWLDNVLEHVIDPFALINTLKIIINDGGYLVIEVPNDFSLTQKYAIDKGLIDSEFWVAVPDHLSYFNRDGLINLCAEAGWSVEKVLADFPIDFFLLNDSSNYVADSSKGKSCHHARVRLDNLFHNIGVEKSNNLYESLAEMGLGRQIIGFFTKSYTS